MPRTDLLMLSEDDLAALTNRGTVKRAQKELEAGQPSVTFEEGADECLVFTWSDGIRCEFPAGKSIHDARCSSGALGITRHIVRSVLAYQKNHRDQASPNSGPANATQNDNPAETADALLVREAPPSPSSSATDAESLDGRQDVPSNVTPSTQVARAAETRPEGRVPQGHAEASVWDPGQISDEALVSIFGAATVTRARTRFQEGTLVELFRGKKPYAIFLDENCCVRFLVPGDARYVTADCVESVLPRYVAMAVWAFRELPGDKQHGLLSLQQKIQAAPVDLLGELDKVLIALATQGVSQLSATFIARLARLENQLRDQALIWPAELIAELTHLVEHYQQHDARFDPLEVSHIVGELVARARAILRDKGQVPQMLIRGSRAERPFDIEAGRYVGLGIAFRTSRHSTTVNAYLQATDTGIVTTIERSYAHAASGTTPQSSSAATTPAKPFHELSEISLYRGVSLARLAQSQVLLKTAKRTVAGELILPRSATSFSLNPQTFQWEQLKPPLLAENFDQVRARLEYQPPGYLGPRRRTAGLVVIPLKRLEAAEFDIVTQKLRATLVDENDAEASLELPYHTRGSVGFDHFLQQLNAGRESVKFVAGSVQSLQGQLRLTPISFVLAGANTRSMIMPYVMTAAQMPKDVTPSAAESQLNADDLPAGGVSPVDDFLSSLRDFSGELLLAGVGNRSSFVEQQARDLAERALATGFVRIGQQLQGLADELASGKDSLHHSWDRAARSALQVALFDRVLM